MRNLILLIGLITFIIGCKKENDDNNFLDGTPNISVNINNVPYCSDSTSNPNAFGISTNSLNYSRFGLAYIFDSLNHIEINLGLVFEFEEYYDNPDCPESYKLQDSIFMSIFHNGSYKFSTNYNYTALPAYEPFVEIRVRKDGFWYSNVRWDGVNYSSNQNNSFYHNNVSVISTIEDWTDCDDLVREMKTQGNFQCFLYHQYGIDSIKINCSSFNGTFRDY